MATNCFIALGGNIGNTFHVMQNTLRLLQQIERTKIHHVSRVFRTTPVSPFPQPHFLNAALHLKTFLSHTQLWHHLQQIELLLGKEKKPKTAPRIIDIDFLFYGELECIEEDLILPHPRWQERLFVLHPLADLVDFAPTIKNKSLLSMISTFDNIHHEEVVPLNLHLMDTRRRCAKLECEISPSDISSPSR